MSETLERLRTKLATSYALVVICVQFGLGLFYLFFGLTLDEAQFKEALIYLLAAVPLAGGVFGIYLPLRYFSPNASFPYRVALFNAAGIFLFYVLATAGAYLSGYHIHDVVKLPFIGLSIGILQCVSTYMLTIEALYPHIEEGSKKGMSLYYKNLVFIALIVIMGIIVVGSVLSSSFEHSLQERPDIGATLLKILLACLTASAIVVALTLRFTSLTNLPLKELARSVRAVSEGHESSAKAMTGDEAADLIGAFNEMVEKVREREEELMLRGQHLALLYSLAEGLNQNKDIKKLFDLTMDWLDATFGLEVGTLRLAKNGFLRLEASKGLTEKDIRHAEVVRVENSLAGLAVLKNETVVVEDISNFDSPYASTARNLGLECLVSIPLRYRSRLIGTLSAASRSRRDILSRDICMLDSLSNLLGVVIERSLEFCKVAEEKFQWEAAVSHIKDAVSIHDGQWRIRKINPAFLEYFGLSEAEVIGRHCFEVFHGADAPPHDCPHIEALITREKSSATFELSKNKRCAVSVHPIVKAHGAMDGCIHIARDVTEMTRLRESLHQADKLSAIGRLTSGIAHNVNNPLTYSLNYLYILKESFRDEKAKELVRKAEQGIDKAKGVLENLLQFSVPSEGGLEFVDMEGIADETIAFLSGAIAEKGISIRKEFSERLRVKASKKAVEEVLINLITNATDAGATEIIIEGYSDPKDVIISVTDNGSGIEPEHIPKLFEPYFTTKPKGKGTGLGLYVSYNIIKSFGGSIWCSSKKGSGTQLFILLPIA